MGDPQPQAKWSRSSKVVELARAVDHSLNCFFCSIDQKIKKEIITYKNKTEAIDKINYYLKNTNEAKEIALNGQKRTFSQYSTQSRIMTFEKICDEILK
jgi:hypothetical protein